MKVFQGLLLVAVMLLSACVGVKTEVGNMAKFASTKYQSYSWVTPPMQRQEGRSQLVVIIDNALRASVDATLASKGYQKVAAEQAQFVVDYRFTRTVSVDQGDRMATPTALQGAFDVGAGMGDANMNREFVPEAISENILRFSVRDKKSKKELWQATASKIIEQNVKSPEKIRKATDQIAGKLFAQFPKVN